MRKLLLVLMLAAGVSLAAQPRPSLRIAVIEGEGAVNIIQQKTALKAVVEVRDQNNVPVPGASVTFAVTGKGGATVAGSQSLTVTTNAAGQASLTGMSPATSGGLQISVNASFNGVSAATTITQTIVATAAAGAAAGAAVATTAATTGAAAAGGGLSTAAIVGIVGGAVAVGAGVAVAGGVGGQRDERDEVYVPPPICVFTVTPKQILVPLSGGSFTVSVTVEPANCNMPTWRVDTNLASNFVTANPTSVTGSGSTTLTVSPFTPSQNFPSRSAAIGVADTFVNLYQPFVF